MEEKWKEHCVFIGKPDGNESFGRRTRDNNKLELTKIREGTG
jgi:hypothetical protein